MSNGVIDAYYPFGLPGVAEYFLLAVGRRFSNSGIRHLATGSSAGPFTDVTNDLPTSVVCKGAVNLGGSVFVCDGGTNKVYESASTDLASWNEHATSLTTNDVGMVTGPNSLVCGSSGLHRISFSFDGTTWATRVLANAGVRVLGFGDNLVVAAGEAVGTATGPTFSYSTDGGDTWTSVVMEVGGTWTPTSICYSGGRWCIANNHGEIWRASVDMSSFAKTLNSDVLFPIGGPYATSMASDGNGTVVAVGSNGVGTNVMAVSTDDGATWSAGDSSFAVVAPNIVAFADGKFHTLGHMSADGSTWATKEHWGTTDFWDRMTALIEVYP